MAQNAIKKRLLTLKEAAEYLGLSPWSLRWHQTQGHLPYLKIGKRIMFDIKRLDQWIEANITQNDR